jgi:hypothetical protein
MNALQTILAAAERGVLVTVTDDGDLAVNPKDRLTPELRAALRENKEEIVAGSRPRKERYEIQQIIPTNDWYVVLEDWYTDGSAINEYVLEPLVAWALVYDHERNLQWIEGVTTNYEFPASPLLVTAIEDNKVKECVRLQPPEEVEDKRTEIYHQNRALQNRRERANNPKGDAARDPNKPGPHTPEEWKQYDAQQRESQEWALGRRT